MKFIFFLNFLGALCKGIVIMGVGNLLRNHFRTVVSMLVRREIPETLIEPYNYDRAINAIRVIGLFVMLIGVGLIVVSFATFIASLTMPSGNFNFNF
jgi:hypothetical protein